MHIFVISLERSTERRIAMQGRLSELGLDAEFFSAVDGSTLPERDRRYDGRRRRLFYGKDMTAGEIGCAQSHVAVCAEIARRGLPCALVLEDDAILADHLPEALFELKAASDKWDLVRFLGKAKHQSRMKLVNTLGNGLSLSRIYGTPGGAYGYAVNCRAAAKLAECGVVAWMPIDTLHGQTWRHGLRVRALLPSPVRPNYEVASTIGDERFSKACSLTGWERITFPFARFGFKAFDAVAKQGTFWTGVLRDRLTNQR